MDNFSNRNPNMEEKNIGWTEKLIETDIDRLLKYLVEEGEASINQAAEDLDVSEEIVENWVSALMDSGLIEKDYTTRRGTLIKAKLASIEEGKETIKKEAKKEVKKAHSDMEGIPELEEAKKHLRNLEKVFEMEEEYAKEMGNALKEIKEDEEELEDETIGPRVLKILEKVESEIGELEDIEEQAEKFNERRKRIESYIDSIERFEDTIKKRMDDETVCNICGKNFKSKRGLGVHMTKIHEEDTEMTERSFLDKVKDLFSKD